MKTMNPKEFIRTVLINEVGAIHIQFPYISFAMMAIGIEFLGKCLNSTENWNKGGDSETDFACAINSLNSFERYRPLLSSHKLWTSLRNGFLHSFVPKNTLTLSSKDEEAHLVEITPSKINLRCEDFYKDFKAACEEVISMETFKSRKMNLPLLELPEA